MILVSCNIVLLLPLPQHRVVCLLGHLSNCNCYTLDLNISHITSLLSAILMSVSIWCFRSSTTSLACFPPWSFSLPVMPHGGLQHKQAGWQAEKFLRSQLLLWSIFQICIFSTSAGLVAYMVPPGGLGHRCREAVSPPTSVNTQPTRSHFML